MRTISHFHLPYHRPNLLPPPPPPSALPPHFPNLHSSSFPALRASSPGESSPSTSVAATASARDDSTPVVEVENPAGGATTLIAVRAGNSISLLRLATRALRLLGLRVHSAAVDPLGGRLTLNVTDAAGARVDDPGYLDRIRRALGDAVRRGDDGGHAVGPTRGGVVVRKAGPGIGRGRAERMFRLMDRFRDNDPASLQEDMLYHVEYTVARSRFSFDDFEAYQAMAHSVRDRLIERWHDTQIHFKRMDPKRIYFLSLEYLLGRSLTNSVINLGIKDQCADALNQLGFEFEVLAEQEGDAALGNGGLARLSACQMDSLATLDYPAWGYGLRYQYGLFRQVIIDGYQHEQPDYWLNFGNPWEIERIHVTYPVKFYGTVEEEDNNGFKHKVWVPGEMVEAVAYDNPIPGYGTRNTITLRLWAAKPSDGADMESFNTGDYVNAVVSRQKAEAISSILYPDDRTYQGKELRLKQQYFFVSASLQDIIRRFKDTHDNFDGFPEKEGGLSTKKQLSNKINLGEFGNEEVETFICERMHDLATILQVALQLNDTHPSLTIAELMRVLIDEEHLGWSRSWDIVCKVFSFSTHTVLPEGLEKVPVDLLGSLLPRHLQIIYDVNLKFIEEVKKRIGSDYDRLARMSIVEEGAVKSIRMANLAVVCSTAVNGVSRAHSELLKTKIFKDFYELWPHKFDYKTNGVTQRRWIVVSNPSLCNLITKWLGTETWIRDMDLLSGLQEYAGDANLQEEWQMVRMANKTRLAEYIEVMSGVKVNVNVMFDVQIKRVHEYKRQFLNILGIIHRYDCIKNMNMSERRKVVPRVCIIGGKAAPGYEAAKKIIKLCHAVADKINNDPDIGDLLKLIFIPDYNVSVAELVIPGTDLSQHLSTAGNEASGTGSMKFLMNGCLLLATADGSTVEIIEEIGEDNMFLFGAKLHQIPALREKGAGKVPLQFARVVRMVRDGYFGFQDYFKSLCDSIEGGNDFYLLGSDFGSYLEAQAAADKAFVDREKWTRMSILSAAGSARFSSDRTIQEYAERTWGIDPCTCPF